MDLEQEVEGRHFLVEAVAAIATEEKEYRLVGAVRGAGWCREGSLGV